MDGKDVSATELQLRFNGRFCGLNGSGHSHAVRAASRWAIKHSALRQPTVLAAWAGQAAASLENERALVWQRTNAYASSPPPRSCHAKRSRGFRRRGLGVRAGKVPAVVISQCVRRMAPRMNALRKQHGASRALAEVRAEFGPRGKASPICCSSGRRSVPKNAKMMSPIA